MEEAQPGQDQDQEQPNPQNPPTQNPDPNPSPDPPITAPSDPPQAPTAPPPPPPQPPAATTTPPPPQPAPPPPQPPLAAPTQPPPQPPAAAPTPPPPQPPPAAAPTPPPPQPAAAAAPTPLQQPPAAAAPTPPPHSVPPESKKRPLDNYGPIQECSYFKMRAVVKDIRPHVLEMLRTGDFQSCKGAEELQEKLKLLMELYKQMTAEKVTITKWNTEPNSSENGVGLKPHEQLQETADQSQPGQIFSKPSEKQQAEHGENQGTHIVGGSAFGWNFITFPGGTPIYYGRTKELFRAAKVTL